MKRWPECVTHRLRQCCAVLACVCVLTAYAPAGHAASKGAPLFSEHSRAAMEKALSRLEAQHEGRLGVALLRVRDGSLLTLHGEERFPLCSTFKLVLAAHVLHLSVADPGLLARRVPVRQADMVPHAPVTSKRIGADISVAELCEATAAHSDNPAANLLLRIVGGPPALTAFARSLHDADFRQDRWEPHCNTALPGDARDTSTPQSMARLTARLVFGDALPAAQRGLLLQWLKATTTGGTRIRAGLGPEWTMGGKTGSGDYGVANDVAVLWKDADDPYVLAVYHHGLRPDAKRNDAIIADVARLLTQQPTAPPQ